MIRYRCLRCKAILISLQNCICYSTMRLFLSIDSFEKLLINFEENPHVERLKVDLNPTIKGERMDIRRSE